MNVSVVLCTYNRAPSLVITLASFMNLVRPKHCVWELLIVDNNSTDGTREVVNQFAVNADFPVRYIFEKQQGRSAALNAGIREARGEIVAFTDDDVILHQDWLCKLKVTFDTYDCSAVAGRVLPQWSRAKPDWLVMEGQFAIVNFDLGDELKEVQVPPLGANSAFRKDIFEKYGLFRLDLGVNGSSHTITCDDTEFGERLIRGGETIIYCPSALIYHPVDPSRTTKKYFLSWYYYNGVSLTRMAGLHEKGVCWFGAPRWLYREALTNLTKWMLAIHPNRRFHHKLGTYRSIGQIIESRRLSATAASNATVAR